MSDDKSWQIQLKIPGEPELLGVVRLATAGICHRLNLDQEQTDDLKLVAAEACGHLLNLGAPEIAVTWEVEGDSLALVAQAVGELDREAADDQADIQWKEIGLLLVQSLMDEVHELNSPPGLRTVKRTSLQDG